MAGNCCNITPNVIGNNSNVAIPANVNQMSTNAIQMKPAAGTSGGGVSHAMVGPSSSHHMHSVPLNLTLKGVMNSVSRTPNATAQPANANMQAGEMHCTNANLPGSSNGKQHSLFRKPQNVHILPPTHSSIRNLAYHQMSNNKNSHCNAPAATFNANGALQTKQ